MKTNTRKRTKKKGKRESKGDQSTHPDCLLTGQPLSKDGCPKSSRLKKKQHASRGSQHHDTTSPLVTLGALRVGCTPPYSSAFVRRKRLRIGSLGGLINVGPSCAATLGVEGSAPGGGGELPTPARRAISLKITIAVLRRARASDSNRDLS